VTPRSKVDGSIFFNNLGPYHVSGLGSSKLSTDNPKVTPPPFIVQATATVSKWIDILFGSTATGNETFSGFYTVNGAPPGGAVGTLDGTATYSNYLIAVSVGKITGQASTTLTSNISIAPFVAQTPGPLPATTTLSVGTGGTVVPTPVAFAAAAIVPNGNYPVNYNVQVTASRTGGVTTAIAEWDSTNFSWELAPPPPPSPPVDVPTGEIPRPPLSEPVVLVGQLSREASSSSPATLAFDRNHQLTFSSLGSLPPDPQLWATSGPSFDVGRASGLGYLSDLRLSPDGQLYALQSFGYGNGNFDLDSSAVLKVDPISGTTSPLPISRLLQVPSAMEFGQDNKFGSETLLSSDIWSARSVLTRPQIRI
jgi:hypothetical protein